MRRFAALVRRLEELRASEREAALAGYLREADEADAAWAVWLLAGNRLPRLLTPAELRARATATAAVPEWLAAESERAVGELAETAAHLVELDDGEAPASASELALHALLGARREALALARGPAREALLRDTWRALDGDGRALWNRLLVGTFRPQASRSLLVRALVAARGGGAATVARRLEEPWEPTPAALHALLGSADTGDVAAGPLPISVPAPLAGDPSALGDLAALLVEWQWDAPRAQLVRRGGATLLWSPAAELLAARFPEIVAAAAALPEGVVLDGVLLAGTEAEPLPRAVLARRLDRERPTPRLLREVPAAFVAFDLLGDAGGDRRARPLDARREALARLLAAHGPDPRLRLSPRLLPASWEAAAALRAQARQAGACGLVLKPLAAPYVAGPQGGWWSWEAEAHVARLVLLYAERGDGGRGATYDQLALGAWHEGELVPVARLAAGLPAAEVREIDRWVRRNLVEAFGPVRRVRPELVFEVRFGAVRRSERHKAGLVLEEPRLAAWRRAARPEDADTLATLRALLR